MATPPLHIFATEVSPLTKEELCQLLKDRDSRVRRTLELIKLSATQETNHKIAEKFGYKSHKGLNKDVIKLVTKLGVIKQPEQTWREALNKETYKMQLIKGISRAAKHDKSGTNRDKAQKVNHLTLLLMIALGYETPTIARVLNSNIKTVFVAISGICEKLDLPFHTRDPLYQHIQNHDDKLIDMIERLKNPRAYAHPVRPEL